MKSFINVSLVCMNSKKEVIERGFITVDKDKIVNLGAMENYKSQGEEQIDAHDQIVMPGLVNAHTHLGLIPFRSLGEDMTDRLRKYIFPMEQKHMSQKVVELASRYGAYESLLNGTTCVADMYYYTFDVAKALDEVGIRALVGQTIIENSQIDYQSEEHALQQCELLIEQYQNHPLITPMIAPHSPVSVSRGSLLKIAELSKQRQTKVMMHLCEMDYEMKAFSPLSPVEYCESLNLLSPHFIGVHMIHTTQHDQEIISKYDSKIVHCPIANMKAAKGIADVKGFMEHDITVGLGSDGPISGNTLDLFGVMKQAALAQKTKYHQRELLSAYEVLEMATIQSAKCLGLKDKIGSLEIGKQADLVFLSTQQANMFPNYHPVATIVYQAQPQNVCMVMVAGQILVQNHQLVTDEFDDVKQCLSEMIEEIKQDVKLS